MEGKSAVNKLIDLDKVLLEKNPKLYKVLPRFVLRMLKGLIYQDGINNYITEQAHIKGVPFALEFLKQRKLTISETGLEAIPEQGRYIFVANHPLGGLDGVAFLSVVGQRFSNIKFPVNDILLGIEGLNEIFIPINKHGAHGKKAATLLEESFSSDNQILFFPAGMVSRKIKGEITDLEWKTNIIKKAIVHNRDIIPVHISGRNSSLFYNFAIVRSWFGIKANIEMVLLPREMFNPFSKNMVISFGKPIACSDIKATPDAKKWIDIIRNAAYDLGKNAHHNNKLNKII